MYSSFWLTRISCILLFGFPFSGPKPDTVSAKSLNDVALLLTSCHQFKVSVHFWFFCHVDDRELKIWSNYVPGCPLLKFYYDFTLDFPTWPTNFWTWTWPTYNADRTPWSSNTSDMAKEQRTPDHPKGVFLLVELGPPRTGQGGVFWGVKTPIYLIHA